MASRIWMPVFVALILMACGQQIADVPSPTVGRVQDAARPTQVPTQAAEATARPTPTPTQAAEATARPTPTPSQAAEATARPTLTPTQAAGLGQRGVHAYRDIFRGGRSMEEVILSSDVIARVNLVDKRTFLIWSIPLPEYPTEITWMPLLEFRFRVHEYLKGSGPNELRGLVHFYSFLTTRDEAQLVAAEMLAAHDTRWDQREAIVFLWSEGWPNTSQFEQMPDQYWIGMMDYVSSSSGRIDDETYSVANRHAKAWLPEAPSRPATRHGRWMRSCSSLTHRLPRLSLSATPLRGMSRRAAPRLRQSAWVR